MEGMTNLSLIDNIIAVDGLVAIEAMASAAVILTLYTLHCKG